MVITCSYCHKPDQVAMVVVFTMIDGEMHGFCSHQCFTGWQVINPYGAAPVEVDDEQEWKTGDRTGPEGVDNE